MEEHIEGDEPNVYADDAKAVDALTKTLNGRALRPPVAHKPKLMSARVSERAMIGLKMTALQLGYVWNGQGNVSMLLEAIGTGTVQVTPTALQPARHL